MPGNAGTYGTLTLTKPAAVKKEPKAVSARPAYGQLRTEAGATGLLFRLDESRGNGKGYDRLVINLNENGDLTDEAALSPAELTGRRPTLPTGYESATFGPIPAPADRRIGSGRPMCYAQMFFARRALTAATPPERAYVGSLRLQAGWYLEATVTVDGVRTKIGLVDSNANFRLGDFGQSRTTRVSATNQENWYFLPGDSWLRDTDNSGRFENRPFSPEYNAFGSIVYFGPTPYRIALKPDCRAVTIDAWTGPLGELALQSQGAQVRSVTLAWEDPAGQWQLIQAGVANGKVRVPPGQYRLYACEIAGIAADQQPLAAGGYVRQVKDPVSVAAHQTVPLACGGPLTAVLTTAKLPTEPGIVRLQASLTGAAGETFSTFGTGKGFASKPTEPTFTLATKDGKQVASGNMEYG